MKRLDELVDVSTLDLDQNNPRLPEEIQGQDQSVILNYLWENDVLEELIESFLTNGYFQSEPLITLPPVIGRRTVVEGNRRLAALMILHQLPPAVAADIALDVDDIPSTKDLEHLGLRRLPAVEAADPDDVASFLGFRHISGMKKWGPEAKARWLFQQVHLRVTSQSPRGVFFDVGRQVGSNARGVRGAYLAYGILRFARDTLQLDARIVQYVSKERFGVWTRLLGTANATEYIGLGERIGNTFEQVRDQIENVDATRLEEVLRDLTPPSSRERAVLGDSRDVTAYSDVLANEPARGAMREFGSLSLAVEIARQGELSTRLQEMTRSVEILTLDIKRYKISDIEQAAAEEFAAAARSLRGAVAAALLGDE